MNRDPTIGEGSAATLGKSLDYVADTFVLVDNAGTIRAANAHARAMLGGEDEHLEGKTLLSLLPASAVSRVADALKAVARQRRKQSFDIQLAAEDNTKWYAGHAYPESGGTVVHLHDVTRRHHLEESLAFLEKAGAELTSGLEEEQIARTLARQMTQGLSDWALVALRDAPDRPFRFYASSVDPAVEDKVLEAAEDLGASGDATCAMLEHSMYATGPVSLARAKCARRYAGSNLWSVVDTLLFAPLRARGEPIGTMVMGRQAAVLGRRPGELWMVDELGRLAGLALNNARLFEAARHATRLREDVLTFVAHDLRSSLNAVMLGASALPADGAATDVDLYLTAKRSVLLAASHMSRLLDDLVDAARLDAGWVPRETTVVALSQLAQEAVDTFRSAAYSRGIRLDLRTTAARDTQVRVDVGRMQEVIGNLVDNALKFTAAGGTVCIEAEGTPNAALLSVSDTGCGIDERELPHIFDRFWQAGTNRRGGAGLGLFIVRRIVEGHRGRVWAESRLGDGTSFHIELPCGRQAPTMSAPHRTAAGVEA